MDARHFDALARALTEAGSRRGLLGLLASLPVLGGLVALFDVDELDARGRRKRRKKRHKHGKGRRRQRRKRKKCTPDAVTQTCAGKCGNVPNNCKQIVDCGACTCTPPCETCFTCQGQAGIPGTCVPVEAGTPCGMDAICCNGSCESGGCCGDAQCSSAAAPDCVDHGCVCASNGNAPCATGETCCTNTGCVDTATDPAHCGSCGNTCSGGTPVCWNGDCVCGDVCADGCRFTTVQAAIDALPAGSTIRICAGTYGTIALGKNLTLIGAGDGDAPASNTILDANQQGRVVSVAAGVTATLQNLRITGGSADFAAGIHNQGNLTMTGCTVTGNTGTANATGGGIRTSGSLTMTNCTVSHNSSQVTNGGGISVTGSLTMTNCTLNNNTAAGYGGGVFGNSSAILQFSGCTIGPENSADDGGGIAVFNSASATLDNTDVTGNSATGNVSFVAGGIYNSSGTVTLQNGSTVTNNTPRNCSGIISGGTCGP